MALRPWQSRDDQPLPGDYASFCPKKLNRTFKSHPYKPTTSTIQHRTTRHLFYPSRRQHRCRTVCEMGLLEQITDLLTQQVEQRGTGVVIAAGFVAFIVLSVVLNVFNQMLPKNANEPPVVFHFFPVIGSTITYGMDPYTFFFKCRAKVSCPKCWSGELALIGFLVWRCLHVHSTWEEDYSVSWTTRKRFHSQWQTQGC